MVMVGEVVATALIEQVIEKLSSAIIEKLGMRDNLNRLQSTLSTINAVLEDAEERSVKENDRVLRDWLTKLKEAAYDADDLLDDFRIEAQRKKLELDHRRPILKKVRFFFTCSNPVVFRVKMSRRINEMRGRLDAIAAERTSFHLEGRGADHRRTIIRERETWSKFDETTVICGRDDDVETIMSLLTEEKDHGPNINVSIVSIVGMGGLGKTTLAQLVFKMVEKKLFDLRIWVYVSQDFDPIRIAREAIASATGERCEHEGLELVGKRLVDILKDKMFLLVLDDVWNENQDEWESKLKPMLNDGKKGSRILVTTRDQKIALMMGGITGRLHTLGGLSDDACWELFKQRAFVRRRGGDKDEEAEEINPQLVKIGKEILKKCGGVPLAAKTLGGFMMFKKTTAEWEAVRDDDIWKLAEVNKGVIASLRLSYMQLSPQVKQCFAYCSIFPKGQRIGKEELIDQWIAQGFIPLSLQSNEIGEQYLGSLLRLSFLQEEDYGFLCTMHDLVHDLAASVAGDDVVTIKTEAEMAAGIPKGCRYATLLHVYSPQSEAVEKSFKKVRALRGSKINVVSNLRGSNLRSLVLSDTGSFDSSSFNSLKKFKKLRYLSVSLGGDKTVLLGSLCSLESLQALHLSDCFKVESIPESIGDLCDLRSLRLQNCAVVSYPDSIGNLENLRILGLSWNWKLKQLPDSVGRLQNLRTLNLSYCFELQALPESVADLVNLEEMNLSSCRKLEHLPDSIERLKNLRRLKLSLCNKLKALPESVTDLARLEEMDLSSCLELEELPKGLGIKMRNLRHMRNKGCSTMKGMPIGLAQLENLRTLLVFIVSEEEERFCSIASLGHMNQLEGELTIKKLERLVRNPFNAKKANLEKKENLRTVAFEWSSRDRAEEEGDDTATAAAATVFENLVPPPGINELTIDGYPGTKYPSWMMQIGSHYSFLKLTDINFVDHKRCDRLPPLGVLPSLERLKLEGMHGIRTIGVIGSASSLKEISFIDMPNFELWTTARLISNGQPVTIFPNLKKLTIGGCSLLKAQPCLPPSIEILVLESSNEELLSSKSLGMFSSMRELTIKNCSAQLEWQGLLHLTGLTVLHIEECSVLSELPECIGDLQSLQSLEISRCDRLTTMPHFLRRLTDLGSLIIQHCPQLESRCKKETGEDWSNISHIPYIRILW